ncbi:hypothetical protein [Gordonia sp. CPCC 205333]|uniref:hypothetical protein n=1 Tax=Gordonia sp. CPCC 205333 TaxID=3140790 RepID=UPI003AF385FB
MTEALPKPARGGYWIGAILIALGVISSAVGLVIGLASLFEGPTVTFTGSTMVELLENEPKLVYVDSETARYRCTLTDATGEQLELRQYPGSLQINRWYGAYVLPTPTPGTYLLTCQSNDSFATFGIGPRMGTGAKAALIAGPLVGLLLVVGGFVLIILTAVRNGRRRPKFPPQPTSA